VKNNRPYYIKRTQQERPLSEELSNKKVMRKRRKDSERSCLGSLTRGVSEENCKITTSQGHSVISRNDLSERAGKSADSGKSLAVLERFRKGEMASPRGGETPRDKGPGTETQAWKTRRGDRGRRSDSLMKRET